MNSLFTKTNVSCLLILLSLNVVYAGTSRVGINGAACAYESVNEAITAASAGDTIYIRPGTYEELLEKIKVDLTLVPSESAGPGFSGCEAEMSSATSATVIIDGQTGTFDSQGGLVQISQSATVTFRHMWLRNAKTDFGGIIAVLEGSELTLDDVLVTDGAVEQAGGNIYLENGSNLQLINDSSVYRGTANFVGGAIALFDSSMTVLDGNIGVSSNNGFSQAGTDGGGIYASNSDVFLSRTQSELQWNEAGRNGGGLYAVNSHVDVSRAMVTDNSAADKGGGLYLKDSELLMFDARINNNSTLSSDDETGGGGIYLEDESAAEIRRTRIIGNTSNNLGGGILAAANTELSVSEVSIIENNTASNSGGGISTFGTLILDDSEILTNSAASGGGVHCESCSSINIMNGSSLRENHATAGFGGGLFVNVALSSHVTDIIGSEMLGNDSFSVDLDKGYGGAIAINKGSLSISNSLIQNNQASLRGGGLFAEKDMASEELNIQFDNVLFRENQVVNFQTNDGGGVAFIDDADSLIIKGTLFENNSSDNIAGALLLNNVDELFINDSLFLSNEGGLVGGLYANSVDGTIKNTRFNENTSDISGGAIRMNGSELNFINTVFDGNQASSGGAIASLFSTFTVDSDLGTGTDQCNPAELGFNQYCSAFVNNLADRFSGGAISVIFDGEVSISNTAFSGNNAPAEGAGSAIYASAASSSNNEVNLNLENVLLAVNGWMNGDASSILMEGDRIIMDSMTLADNMGAPILIPEISTDVTLINSIIFNNSVAPEVTFGANFTRSCNNSQEPSANSQSMGGNLGDPLFATTSRGDYRLSAASPSRNACATGPVNDLDGLFRDINTGLYDQGAFELDGLVMDPDIIFDNGFE